MTNGLDNAYNMIRATIPPREEPLPGTGQMGTTEAEAAFAAAFSNNDCEELIAAVEAWANKPYRTADSILDVIPCVQSGMHAFFARKEDECRKAWKTQECLQWQEARSTFDAGMRAFVRALATQPNPEDSRPAIGGGWGKASQPKDQSRPFTDSWGRPLVPKHDSVPA